ncbi:MAG TPA: pentapeptide repeat-containing protein [Streptosporangiaceae bacterium]|nr:pentapeptide repeat-containing protein [Streptosporangiaceae bacterium]
MPDHDLAADCARCAGLCCVVPAFTRSADFAISKPAGQPCPNLGPDSRCAIHAGLRDRGFGGCAAYDCFGAGQQTVQVTFGGRDWRSSPGLAAEMFAAFGVMRQLNELRWHLAQAAELLSPGGPAGSLSAIGAIREELSEALRAAQGHASGTPEMLIKLDISAHRDTVSDLLRRVSAAVRTAFAPGGQDLRGADLAGADLRPTVPRGAASGGAAPGRAGLRAANQGGASLRGASLRGALLIGADLTGADLAWADLTGADLRGARVGGADLSGALFLSRNQAGSALGDARTRLPAALPRPAHWV